MHLFSQRPTGLKSGRSRSPAYDELGSLRASRKPRRLPQTRLVVEAMIDEASDVCEGLRRPDYEILEPYFHVGRIVAAGVPATANHPFPVQRGDRQCAGSVPRKRPDPVLLFE